MTLFSKVESGATFPTNVATRNGRIEISFALSPDGRTYLSEQYANYPFHVCRPQYVDANLPDLATLYIQSCSGGIYEGDHLEMRLLAAARTTSHVTTQSSTVVHSMPVGSARQDVFIEAGEGAYVEFLPDPQVLFPESRFDSVIRIRKGRRSTTLVSDALLAHDPSGSDSYFASYTGEIRIESDTGEVLAIDRQKIDGQMFASRLPGVTGRFSAQGSLVIVNDDLPRALQERVELSGIKDAAVGATALPNNCGLLVRVLASDGISLRNAMHAIWSVARTEIKGSAPTPRRK